MVALEATRAFFDVVERVTVTRGQRIERDEARAARLVARGVCARVAEPEPEPTPEPTPEPEERPRRGARRKARADGGEGPVE